MSVWTSTVIATPENVDRPSSSASTTVASVSMSEPPYSSAVADAEEAQLAHFSQHRARHHAVLLPLQRVRLDLLVDEAADLVPQQFMLLAEIDGARRGIGDGRIHQDLAGLRG